MGKFRDFKSLVDYIDSAPGNRHTCAGCNMWNSKDNIFDCPKGGLVHKAQVMKCHSYNGSKVNCND